MAVPPRTLRATPGQTVGPFFAYGVGYDRMHQVAHPHAPGTVLLGGTVYDGAGDPVPDAFVEIFGADSDGRVPHSRGAFRRDDHTFTGFGRAFTDGEGHFEFFTREPGSVGKGAPFFAAVVYARGLAHKLHTRIYLPLGDEALAADPFLSSLTAEERSTLIAERADGGGLHHDVRLQGERETVFLAF
ncbi:protocatechuate 3,4-dioxygenase subunit alpha [Herbiconiux sp. KACC 21604]|uniref:protocatechuate 3,4-dioxygenase subunit alpha n=1 Tax=unclassified Herbiconiux TaxID=2618217 RepID=UPI001492D417|nr:protocatechuate 3,4-dioxygenase subunit alpha [Herbiconiux sp. SALV-R1]QJU55657.1 protocatechuate 3,4-dioxygenase subunit alpha [Herbiconiux sp. SALV-R1]WPO86857.1 protocatechuate 3,4-dioxygenase subunit alpha [Herbiconiux sp. KACC 21604]